MGSRVHKVEKTEGASAYLISNMEIEILAVWAALNQLPKKFQLRIITFELFFLCFHGLKNDKIIELVEFNVPFV